MAQQYFDKYGNYALTKQQVLNNEYAGFWVRSWAISIDSMIIFALVLATLFIAGFFIDTHNMGERFALFVMDFLTQKMAGLQDMPMSTPDDMRHTLTQKLGELDMAFVMYFLPVHLIFSVFYYALPESSRMQGSIGKYLMKIKIVNIQGERIGFIRAVARNMIKIIPGSFYFILSIAIFIPVIFDKQKRGVHDMLCKTYVVYR